MADKKPNLKPVAGFSKAYNPHLKRNKNHKKTQEEEKKMNHDSILPEPKEKEKSGLKIETKETFAQELIRDGYIDSYIDFFYLGWRKTPNLKKKYSKQSQEEEDNQQEDQKAEENENEEEEEENDKLIPRHDYSLEKLKVFYNKLKIAENASREAEKEENPLLNKEAIAQYNSIRNDTLHDSVAALEAIYFNQKCIDIAKKYELTESLIQSLINMGGCFDKGSLPVGMGISKNLKEKAKEIYKEKLDGQNYPLEYKIYKALVDLYTELANQQEQMKNYKKAIDLLNKLLVVLDNIKSISGKVKDCMTEKQMEDTKTEAYLKISNIYYRTQDYDNTIKTLDLIPNIKTDDVTSLNVSIIFFYLRIYSNIKFKDYIDMLKLMKKKIIKILLLLI